MNVRSWRKVEALAEKASDLAPGQRKGFLAERCRGDDALRRDVERFLEALEAGCDFLEAASWAPGRAFEVADEEVLPQGFRVGAYRIEGLLGRGGMATVYRARRADGCYRRNVALKVIRRDRSGEAPIRRFRVERQILAHLSHPNIPDLLDGGTLDDGRPYLAMELVDGIAIDVYCDRHRLSVEDRLELFHQVCSAVECTHRHRLVHRDLKPSNILVSAGGVPKLLDFGIAKLLDPGGIPEPAARTRTDCRPMTPLYASPEQIRGESVTPVSDVYALGLVLYELLTGRLPYRFTERPLHHEIERAICEERPLTPSQAVVGPAGADPKAIADARRTTPARLRRRLAGDLDDILLKALSKSPHRRYRTVGEMSGDLVRCRDRRPADARRLSLASRVASFVRGHRAASAVTLGAAAVLAVDWGLRSARRQGERLAEREAKKKSGTASGP